MAEAGQARKGDGLSPAQHAEELQQAGDRLLAETAAPEGWSGLGFNVWYPACEKSYVYQVVAFGTLQNAVFYYAVFTSEPREQDLTLALDRLFAHRRIQYDG